MDNPAVIDTENNRRIENLVRAGTVMAVDYSTARCRVASGLLKTDWKPWVARRAGDVKHWSPPSVGEQCILVSPGGDMASAFVLLGVFSDSIAQNGNTASVERTTYPDGAVIEYDHAIHALQVTLPAGGTADITAPASVTVHSQHITLDTPQTTITGDVQVSGSIQVDGDVTASGVSLVNHLTTGVVAGASLSGKPQ